MEKRKEMKKTSSQIYKTSQQTRKWQRERGTETERLRQTGRQSENKEKDRGREGERERGWEKYRERQTERMKLCWVSVKEEAEALTKSSMVVEVWPSRKNSRRWNPCRPNMCTQAFVPCKTQWQLKQDPWWTCDRVGGGGGGGRGEREASGIAKERQWGRRGMPRSTGK